MGVEVYAILIAVAIVVGSILFLVARGWRGNTHRRYWGAVTAVGYVLVAIACVLASMALLVIFGPLGIVLLILLVTVALAIRQRRAAQRYSYLWMMAMAAERSMPLGPAIEAFVGKSRGHVARRWRRIAVSLNEGVPLADALARTSGAVPVDALPAIHVGLATGQLGTALRRAIAVRERDEPFWRSLTGKLLYLWIVLLFYVGIATFLIIKILPAFQKIAADFEVELPAITNFTTGLLNACLTYGTLPMLVLLVAALVYSLYIAARYTGTVRFDLPGTAWLSRRMDGAVVLDTLALVTEQRGRLPEVIGLLARTYPRLSIRRRLRRVERRVLQGADWCESLCCEGLIKQADLAVLKAAQRVGNLSWAMREMAQSNRRRHTYRLNLAMEILFPLAVAGFAGIVFLFVVSYFLPLISLIAHLT